MEKYNSLLEKYMYIDLIIQTTLQKSV